MSYSIFSEERITELKNSSFDELIEKYAFHTWFALPLFDDSKLYIKPILLKALREPDASMCQLLDNLTEMFDKPDPSTNGPTPLCMLIVVTHVIHDLKKKKQNTSMLEAVACMWLGSLIIADALAKVTYGAVQASAEGVDMKAIIEDAMHIFSKQKITQ